MKRTHPIIKLSKKEERRLNKKPEGQQKPSAYILIGMAFAFLIVGIVIAVLILLGM